MTVLTPIFPSDQTEQVGLAAFIIAAILDFQTSISQSFEELKSSNLEVKLMTLKPMTGNNFDIDLSIICFTGLPLAATLDFLIFISQPFKELKG